MPSEQKIAEMLVNQAFVLYAEQIVKENVKPGYQVWLEENYYIQGALV